MRWDGVGWGGVRGDGMGWDEVRGDEMGWGGDSGGCGTNSEDRMDVGIGWIRGQWWGQNGCGDGKDGGMGWRSGWDGCGIGWT